jgi:tetratricopeptide (TPR) repeat protein/CHAT domain-containing protein
MLLASNPEGRSSVAQALFDAQMSFMFRKHVVLLLGSLVFFVPLSVSGQAPTAKPAADQPPAPGLRKLNDADKKRTEVLYEQIDKAVRGDRWDEAIARAEEALALRTRVQGAKHFDTVIDEWWVKALRRVAAMPRESRAAYRSAEIEGNQGAELCSQRKYAEAQPLLEKALANYRRLLGDDHPDTARSYSRLAMIFQAQGKYAEAQPLFEKSLEINRRVLTDDHPDTASSYLSLAIHFATRGRYAQAQPLFEKALEINRRLLTDDHPDTAKSYNDLATNLYAGGKYAAAQPLYEKALDIRRRLLTDDNPATAESYINLANILERQGKYVLAQPLFEKALEIRRRIHGENHRDTARSYNALATNLEGLGKTREAQPFFEKALEIRRRLFGDGHPDTALSYTSLAMNLNHQGEYAEAQPLLAKALEINRRFLTDDHPVTAGSYNGLGLNLHDQGKYAEAQPLFEKALEISRRLLTDNHPDTAGNYNNLAMNLSDRAKYAEAQPLFEKALEISRRLLTDNHPNTAGSYSNLALNLKLQGKYAEAQPLFEKALEVTRRLLTDNHRQTAMSYINLARNLMAQGKYVQAQPLFEKALEIYRGLLTDDCLETAHCSANLAANLNAQGRYVEARDRWQAAVKGLDAARLRVAFTGLERAGTGALIRPALAAVLARLGRPAEAWRLLEEDLGRGLLDELAARRDRQLTPAERRSVSQLTTALEQLDKLVETAPQGLDQAERAKRFDDLKHRRELASVALGELQTALVRKYGAAAGRVSTLSEIQAEIPADVALVAWVDIPPVGPNAADPHGEHWGVVLRSRGVPAWVPIAGTGSGGLWTEDDTRLAGRVGTLLSSRTGIGPADLRSLTQRLRAQRIEPLAKALSTTPDGLPAAHKLIILPSRAMAGIPVEALLADDDTRTVSYAPSATVYKFLREKMQRDHHTSLLALGDPVYGRPAKASEPKLTGDAEFTPLPGTKREVEAIARLFESENRLTKSLLGSKASEPELDRLASTGELGRFGVIHLATHAVIDEEMPGRSAVILTQTGLPDPLEQVMNHKPVFDGRLTVREIQRAWDLKADLVTLSACETATGPLAGGEGFVGFIQALLMSGARGVCLSLWRVDDQATTLLMARFYQNILGKGAGLSKPMPKAEALQEAKHWLRSLTADHVDSEWAALERGGIRPLAKGAGAPARKDPASTKPSVMRPYDHPYFWAAFVLVGDPD